MRALTGNEITILKSRFQAGTDGHSQKVVLTATVPTASGSIQDPYFPWAARLSSGNAGLVFKAHGNPVAGAYRVWFLRYKTQHVLIDPIELFPYDTVAYGIVTYRGTLLAACWKPSDGSIVFRTSSDGGVSWTVEATLLPAASYLLAEVEWGSAATAPSFQLTTDKAGTTLYIFTIENNTTKLLRYKATTALDPTTGWSATTNTGLTIPSLGRNYGGPTARNQGIQRAFVACESKTQGTWLVACEADDGDWHANHMATQGTLGGAWTRKLNAGYGGGLSGGQGANGMLFLDRSGDLLFYVMSDDGEDASAYRSTDSGSTWTGLGQQMPATGAFPGLGSGAGFTIPEYDFQEYVWSHLAGGGTCIEVSALKAAGSAAVANLLRIIGSGASSQYVTATTTSVDVSDRVRAISLQKDDEADAASFNLEIQNSDGFLNVSGTDAAGNAAALAMYAAANVQVDVYQWHGLVANSVRTFAGIVDNVQENTSQQLTTLVGRDLAKKLLVQRVIPNAPQYLDQVGYVRDMSNYVYLNKTLDEVLDDFLLKAGLDSTATGRTWAPSTYVFKELIVSSGYLMDAAKLAAQAAGMRFWFDEDRLARTAPVAGPQAASVWTYRAREDLQTFDADVSDDRTFTRVRVIGKANLGAKYLAEQFIWPAPAADVRAIAYDSATTHVWVLCGNKHLYRLDPAANMAIVTDTDLSAWLAYPDSIDVGPDGHLWIADGFDATLGANASRQFRKVDRAAPGTTLLGPFANPDQLHVRLWHDQVNRLWMDTYASPAALVKMSDTTGAEILRVVSPVNFPMGFDSDGQGGAFITGLDQVDLYQIDLAGNIVNTVKQPAKNSNELGLDHNDLGLYAVFVEQDTIVKYAVAGAPSGVATATLALAIDAALELVLFGEVRVLDVIDLSITDLAMATSTALRTLARVSQYTNRTQAGAIGNPGLQLHDRVTVAAPSQGVAAGDYMIRSIRSDQLADSGTYLAVLGLEPYSAAF